MCLLKVVDQDLLFCPIIKFNFGGGKCHCCAVLRPFIFTIPNMRSRFEEEFTFYLFKKIKKLCFKRCFIMAWNTDNKVHTFIFL